MDIQLFIAIIGVIYWRFCLRKTIDIVLSDSKITNWCMYNQNNNYMSVKIQRLASI